MSGVKLNVEDFRYLWESPDSNYALARLREGSSPDCFIIIDTVARTIVIIEDDAISLEVRTRMLATGCRVVEPPFSRP
jgi:hypothetical protein